MPRRIAQAGKRCAIIPILAQALDGTADVLMQEPTLKPTRLLGDPQHLQPLLDALAAAAQAQLPGLGPPARWLRELRLAGGEAYALITPDLGHDSLEAAELAFDTLRRLLPDTDIYVSAAPC